MVLVVERDTALASVMREALQAQGLAAVTAESEKAGLHQAREADLAIVDLNTSEERVEVLRRYRAEVPDIPLVAITAVTSVEHRLRCLEGGADDCLVKPFAISELMVRCRTLLRRHQPALLRVDDLTLHRVERRVRRSGQEIMLTRKEFDLLECLLLHAGRPVSRAEIAATAWRAPAPSTSNLVDVFVNSLRKKIDAGFERKLIHTVRRAGYQVGMAAQPQTEAAGHVA